MSILGFGRTARNCFSAYHVILKIGPSSCGLALTRWRLGARLRLLDVALREWVVEGLPPATAVLFATAACADAIFGLLASATAAAPLLVI